MKQFQIKPTFRRSAALGVPEVHGLKPDLSNQSDARHYAENGVKMKGVFFTSKVGTTSDIVIDLSGTAKMLLGFKFVTSPNSTSDARVSFSLNINQEQVIQDSFVGNHDNLNNYRGEYTPLVRMLSGKDNIRLNYTDVSQNAVGIEFWYI